MKPAPFKYFAPSTVEEALSLLGEYGYEAKPLAGGQSLIPAMNFRLAQPAVLVDLNRIPALDYIRPAGDGGLRIGAMTRQRRLERDPLIAERAPLLRETMPHIAHPQIRNRGTYGGALAHADPSAELPAVSVALRARMKIRNRQGERWVAAEDFFIALFATALEPEDLLLEITLPPLPPRTGTAFAEVARRHGDYALAGVAAVVTRNEDDTCAGARLVFLSVGDGPVIARQAIAALRGQPLTAENIRAAAHLAAAEDIEPGSDIHASADFRRHLAEVLARRALQIAAQRAKGGTS